ncbi:ABC transporter permease [Pseudogemmobacter humi]|uniref:Inner membrane ABC transporter permease protein YdcV n=1 Tax=Pseudogemmobacter humi TaxID=2483812 RepID=A0A3P5XFR7_9RHOB|nr:ABC transporter permease [Pseudogemmobacter humi]VDC33601.1 Inner membrane ABC transporter permease protein YdcV [Pseudogemmobacter humi]
MKQARGLNFAITLSVIFAAVMMILPNAVIIPASFNGENYITFPPTSLSTRWYETFLTDPVWRGATWNSLVVAVLTAMVATVLGTLAALGLMRLSVRARSLLVSLFLLPTIVPTIISAVALYGLLAQMGGRGGLLGIIIGHTIITLPFVVVNVVAALQQMDVRMEHAARSLGASPLRAFWHVTLPVIWPGIAAGAVFAFLCSFSEIVMSLFLSGAGSMTLPVQMWSGIRFEINPTVAAASSVFVVLSCAIVALMGFLRRKQGKAMKS